MAKKKTDADAAADEAADAAETTETEEVAPAEDAGAGEAEAPQPGQIRQRITVDDAGIEAAYSNFCRVQSTPEELILDLGLNPTPFANGDITDARSAARCLEVTGAAGLMFGRGAIGNPCIFGRSVMGLGLSRFIRCHRWSASDHCAGYVGRIRRHPSHRHYPQHGRNLKCLRLCPRSASDGVHDGCRRQP